MVDGQVQWIVPEPPARRLSPSSLSRAISSTVARGRRVRRSPGSFGSRFERRLALGSQRATSSLNHDFAIRCSARTSARKRFSISKAFRWGARDDQA
jgi:hypothetical protein